MRVEPTFSHDIAYLYIMVTVLEINKKHSCNNSLFSSSHYCVPLLCLLVLVTAGGLFRPTLVNILELSYSTTMFNLYLIMNIEPASY